MRSKARFLGQTTRSPLNKIDHYFCHLFSIKVEKHIYSLSQMIFLIIPSLLIGLVGLLVFLRWNYGTLEKLNIPIADRSFLFGSKSSYKCEYYRIQHLEDYDRFKKLGPVYGVYEGREPQIHICDPTLVQLITLTHFDTFPTRKKVKYRDPYYNELLDFLEGEKWKKIKALISTALTKERIGLQNYIIGRCAEGFVYYLHTQCEAKVSTRIKVDVKKTFGNFVIDLLAQTSFGVNVGDPYDPENKMMQGFRAILGEGTKYRFAFFLSLIFPFLKRRRKFVDQPMTREVLQVLREKIMNRRLVPRADGLAEEPNDHISIFVTLLDGLGTLEFRKLGITEATLMGQLLLFIVNAFEPLTNTLTIFALNLAKHPEIQEKLLAEVDWFLNKYQGRVEHENLEELEYLTACFEETLRLSPPTHRLNRVASKDFDLNGLRIKKGMTVVIPLWGMNRDPNSFQEPDKFVPERFMPEQRGNNCQYPLGTFGHGPRACLGRKFALEAMKTIGLLILRDFWIVSPPVGEISPKFKSPASSPTQFEPIFLDFVKRY